MEIGSGAVNQVPSQVQTDVLKKTQDVQEQAITRLLDDGAQQQKQLQEQTQQTQDTQKNSTAQLTGLGIGLDISA
jgi:t-SNARE complex subunit (syntaxin)